MRVGQIIECDTEKEARDLICSMIEANIFVDLYEEDGKYKIKVTDVPEEYE